MKLLILGLLTAVACVTFATGPTSYVHDIENLLNSLDSKDPARPDLTLKLADALFNQARELSGKPTLTTADTAKVLADRKKAIALYRDVTTGLHGLFPALSGPRLAKVKFQLARLYSDTGEASSADVLFRELSAYDGLPDIQRESLLRLAEKLEMKGGKAELEMAAADFKKALTLCTDSDNCAYCHYRLGWVYSRLRRMPEAVAEIEQSMFDAKGQVREESLRDDVAFLAASGDDGKNSLAKVEKLITKTGKSNLVEELSDAYFAQGNRPAGVYVLEAYQRRQPTARNAIRLLEEQYGFRDWARFDSSLDSAIDLGLKANSGVGAESEKILKRLTVQLDGERASHPERATEFKRTVLFYLDLFPDSIERRHMMDGWLAAETDNKLKLDQLEKWIKAESRAERTEDVVRLRKMRAGVAQQTKSYDIVVAETHALNGLATSAADKREYQYQTAYALYEKKDLAAALPSFLQIATPPQPDKWGIQSEHLSLDILAQKKDYDRVLAQARVWTRDPRFAAWLQSSKDQGSDLASLKNIEQSAEFEKATLLGNTAEALQVFMSDCEHKLFIPKSCNNAQVVAEKTGDEGALIKILQMQDKKADLANELEASAEFAKAAELRETALARTTASVLDQLKVAMLFELGNKMQDRDRVLRQLMTSLRGQKTLGPNENALLKTFIDATLVDPLMLSLAWNPENRSSLDEYQMSHGHETAEIRGRLVQSCKDTGPGWEKATIEELRRLDDKQKKIHFAGAGSKRKFEERVAGLKHLQDKGDCYLRNSSAQQRVIIAAGLSRSSLELANEIKGSSLPDGVDEAARTALMKALGDMAQPFEAQSEKFKTLAQEQLEKVTDPAVKEILVGKITKNDGLNFDGTVEADAGSGPSLGASRVAVPNSIMDAALQELHRNPNQRISLEQLKGYYDSVGNIRLAAYFQGRLEQLASSAENSAHEEVKR